MSEPEMTIKALRKELPWPWIRVFPLKRNRGGETELGFVTSDDTTKIRDGNIFAWMLGRQPEDSEFPVLFTGSPEEITNEGWRGD